jgi:hypothetical protein
MNHLLRILSLIFVLTISAFADPISVFTNLSASFSMQPNDGSGDNMGGSISGPGVNLVYGGGTNWFMFDHGFASGSVFPTTGLGIFPDYTVGTVGSQGVLSLGSTYFDMSSFTFSANGNNSTVFTVTVPASMGPIHGGATGDLGFTLVTNPGNVTLTFEESNLGMGLLYYPVSGTFSTGTFSTTPEPGTLGLMGIGVGAIIWCKYKQKWAPRPTV